MAGDRYLVKPKGRATYAFQMAIPKDLQAHFGRKLVTRSLETGDRKEAARRAREWIDHYHAEFARLRGSAEAVAQAKGDLFRLMPDTESATPDGAALAARVARGEAHWKFRAARHRLRQRLGDAADAVNLDGALTATKADLDRKAAAVEAAAAVITGTAPEPSFPAGPTMDEVFVRWKREARPTDSSVRECEYSVRKFGEAFGLIAVADITKPMIREFRDMMLLVPTRLPDADSKLPVRVMLTKYQGRDVPRASLASARKRLSFIKTLLQVAVDAGMIEESPAEGVRINDNGTKPGDGRSSFEPDELAVILREANMKGESFAWITRLGMYTGCRLGEIVQLRRADVKMIDGIAFLDINGREGKAVKTDTSIRPVPLHPDIREIFLDFVKGKEGRLFPDVSPGKNGDPTDLISKKWNYWRKKIGMARAGLCFHSLRHSFKDACREAGISEEIHDALTGHAGDGVGRRYGGRPPLRVLAEAVARLRFPVPL